MTTELWIDQWRQPDGTYLGPEGTRGAGCTFDDAVSFYHSGIFGFCGCGEPRANLRLIRDALALTEEFFEADTELGAWNEYCVQYGQRRLALFGTLASEQFFAYWANETKPPLMEHGGCIPGWLTDHGRRVLADLQVMGLDEEEKEPKTPKNSRKTRKLTEKHEKRPKIDRKQRKSALHRRDQRLSDAHGASRPRIHLRKRGFPAGRSS